MLGHMKEFLWILSNQIDLVCISLDNLLEENFFLPSIDPLSPIIIRIVTTQTVLRLFFSMKIYEKRSGIFYPVAYTSVNFSEFSAAKSIKKFKFTLLVKNYSPILKLFYKFQFWNSTFWNKFFNWKRKGDKRL